MPDPFPALVGRAAELAALDAAFARARAGRGGIVMLTGEAGIGKTRVAYALGERASAAGALVLRGACYDGEWAPAFGPIAEALTAYARASEPARLRDELGSGAAPIAQVLPAVAERVPGLAAPQGLGADAERFRLFDSVGRFLAAIAARQPLVLLLDDLHWVDSDSAALLRFVARSAAQQRLLVVGTCRDEAAPAGHPSIELRSALQREAAYERVRLVGLDPRDSAALVESVAPRPLPAGVAATIASYTTGNPFFIREVVQHLAEEGALDDAGRASAAAFGIPGGVRQVVERRLLRLAPDTQRLLTVAASFDGPFPQPVSAAVAGLDGRAALAAVDEALRTRLIVPMPRVDVYDFSHALIRDTLYTGLSPSSRVALHRDVATAMQAIHRDDGEHAAAIARHCLAARDAALLDQAIHYSRLAAEHATRRLAYEDASLHYERALTAFEAGSAEGDPVQHAELLLLSGESHNRAGHRAPARDAFQRAASLAQRLPATAPAPGSYVARAALGLGYRATLEAGRTDEILVGVCEDALRLLGDGDSAERALVLAQLAFALSWADASAERRTALAREALAIAQRLDDRRSLPFILEHYHYAAWSPDNLDERLATARAALPLAEAAGDVDRSMHARYYAMADLVEAGDVAAFDVELARFEHLARELRQPLYSHIALLLRTMRTLLAGEFGAAEQLAHEAYALGEQAANPSVGQALSAQLLVVWREQGRLGEARLVAADFVQRYEQWPVWRCALAFVHAENGDYESARAELAQLARGGFAAIPRDNAWLVALGLLADVCVHLEDQVRASALYALLEPYAGSLVVVPVGVACTGSVAHFLGQLATTARRWDDAARQFERALRVHGDIRAGALLARTQYEYGRMLRRRGAAADAERATALLADAGAAARRLGMPALLGRIAALGSDAVELLVRDGVRAFEPRPPAAAAPAAPMVRGVFRREGEFWTVGLDGPVARLRDGKGLQYLAMLLRHGGRELHAADLVGGFGAPDVAAGTDGTGIRAGVGDAGAILDPQARAAYRARLGELAAELEEARGFNDLGRVERLEAEVEALRQQLAAGVGLGGRDRAAASAAERARQNATRAIRTAIERIGEHQPDLARHLTLAVRTGVFCSYQPDPALRIEWEL